MTNYGAFVEIENDIDGMIHVSDMSWTRKINNPNEVLKPGQEVEVVILEINPEQQRISLGLKQAENDPWSNISEQYKVGDIVKGNDTKITVAHQCAFKKVRRGNILFDGVLFRGGKNIESIHWKPSLNVC
jgi:ribosomal protein S1